MDTFEQAKALFCEGLQLLQASNAQGAEWQFTRALELLPERVSTLNNLSAAKLKLGKFAEAEALARRALAAGDPSPEAWSNLGLALSALGRHAEALQAHERALACQPTYSQAWLNRATTLLELGRLEEALAACDRALELDAGQPESLYLKSRCLKELGRAEGARKTYLASLELRAATAPVLITQRRASQRAEVLIVSQDPGLDGSLKSFEALHRDCPNFPGQLAARLAEQFHFSFLFARDAASPVARRQLPPPHVVINNCANGEQVLSGGHLPALTKLVDSLGVPVVNHPAKVVQTTREATVRLLADIPGLRLPRTQRFRTTGKTVDALLREIEAQYRYPLITRTLALQEGKGMNKIDSRDALAAVLSANPPEQFLVTEFVDSRGGRQFYRKLRAAVVQDQIILVREDYDTHWKIYGRKSAERVAFCLKHPHLLEHERQLCQDPAAALGNSALQTLRAIRARVPLEIYRIDYDEDPEGAVVFYEANATMNLLSTARPEVPYPKQADETLEQALRHYLLSLAIT